MIAGSPRGEGLVPWRVFGAIAQSSVRGVGGVTTVIGRRKGWLKIRVCEYCRAGGMVCGNHSRVVLHCRSETQLGGEDPRWMPEPPGGQKEIDLWVTPHGVGREARAARK